MNQNSIRRLLVPFVFLSIVILGIVLVVNYFLSFKDVSFEVKNPNKDSYTLKVYPSEGHDLTISQYETKTPKHTLNSDATVSLRTGEYVAIVNGNDDLKPQIAEFDVSDNTSVSFTLQYAEKKLATLLSEERNTIRGVIYKRFPSLKPNANIWKFIDDKLHEQGQWYTATFRERADKHSDIYRLVAEKKDGIWQVVTDPPDLVITTNNYPSVPRAVLVDLNERQVVQPRDR